MSVAVEKTPAGAPAVTIGGGGGFVSDPAWQLTTILMTQRMSDGAKPTVTFNLCDDDARRLSG
ncbi:hypothetical protein ACIQUG_21980 [Ensifer sp. NPDC090286]|uniref:hypothetical protein n=1 Tax=Ensifer sp. NPDC090286 TaxID=3363991 RepID=UPI003839EA1A